MGTIVSLLGMLTLAAAPEPRVQAVQAACTGAAEAETHLAVLISNDILSVQELKAREAPSQMESPPAYDGARMIIGKRPFVTADWIRRIAACHLTRTASLAAERDPTSPLDVKGAQVSVTDLPGGLAIDVTSPNHDAAREILRRALALEPTSP